MLVSHLAQRAHEEGVADILLRTSFQVEGDDFYARSGFYPDDSLEELEPLLTSPISNPSPGEAGVSNLLRYRGPE